MKKVHNTVNLRYLFLNKIQKNIQSSLSCSLVICCAKMVLDIYLEMVLDIYLVDY